MNFGISFGFGVDGLEALALSCLQMLLCGTAVMVQRHLSTSSRPWDRMGGKDRSPGGWCGFFLLKFQHIYLKHILYIYISKLWCVSTYSEVLYQMGNFSRNDGVLYTIGLIRLADAASAPENLFGTIDAAVVQMIGSRSLFLPINQHHQVITYNYIHTHAYL